MTESDLSGDRVAELEEAWKASPDSRIFLQLANEYRLRGELSKAIQVLTDGLKIHPSYVSAQVALGRCHLAFKQGDAAVKVLSGVVGKDPTHLLANRLLVEAYLETGDLEMARKRLEHYGLLNPGDGEIEILGKRIDGGVSAPETTAAAAVSEDQGGDVDASTVAGLTPAVGSTPSREEPFAALFAGYEPTGLEGTLGREGIFVAPPGIPPTEVEEATSEREPRRREPEEETLTLAHLYLSQGHRDDAVRIFEKILAREPGNELARSSLAQLRPEGSALSPASESATVTGESLPLRKAVALRTYLDGFLARAREHVS